MISLVLTLLTASTVIAATKALRIAEYNLDCADIGNDNNITGANAGITAVIQAMGQHHIGVNAQPVDVLGLTELLPVSGSNPSQTLTDLVGTLNNIYGAGTYAYDPTHDPIIGTSGGPNGLIYNTKTVKVLDATALADSSSGAPRAPMRYELQAVGSGSISNFYFYVSHFKADSTSTDMDRRNVEAQEIRSDAASLGSSAHFIISGDMNLAGGASEAAYGTLTKTGSGKAYDPVAPGFVSDWVPNSSAYQSIYSHSTTSLGGRNDLELVSKAMFDQPGLQLAPDHADPYDPRGFPSVQYPYAYEVFGNNGSTPQGSSTDRSANTSLFDLGNSSTILGDLLAPSGSDHLPVEADYIVVTPEPGASGVLLCIGIPLAMLRRAKRLRRPSPPVQ